MTKTKTTTTTTMSMSTMSTIKKEVDNDVSKHLAQLARLETLDHKLDNLSRQLGETLHAILAAIQPLIQKLNQTSQQLDQQRSVDMAIHDDIQAWIQQAKMNEDVESSAVTAINQLLAKLEEQVSADDLAAVRQTIESMRASAGTLGAAIAGTGSNSTAVSAAPTTPANTSPTASVIPAVPATPGTFEPVTVIPSNTQQTVTTASDSRTTIPVDADTTVETIVPTPPSPDSGS